MQKHSKTPLVADFKVLPSSFPATCLLYTQEYRPYSSLHYHNCLELGLCVKGSGAEMIANKLYRFSENTITAIPENCIHDSHINSKIDEECSRWKFIFIDLSAIGIPPCNFSGFLSDNETLVNLFNIMYNEIEQKNKNFEFTVKNLLSTFLIFCERINGDMTAATANLPLELADIIGYIHSSYNKRITLLELSEKYNISGSTLNRMFNLHFGVSPLAYINDLRLTVAENMLLSSNISVLSIADAVGFESLSSFNRLFKKKHKVSPRIFRNNRR